MMNTMAKHRRPIGITILAILLFLEGILGIIAPAFFVGVRPGINQALGLYVYGFTALISVLILVMAWGLWTLKRWAFQGMVIIQFCYFIGGVVGYTQHTTDTTVAIGQIVGSLLLLLYFSLGHVRRAFNVESPII